MAKRPGMKDIARGGDASGSRWNEVGRGARDDVPRTAYVERRPVTVTTASRVCPSCNNQPTRNPATLTRDGNRLHPDRNLSLATEPEPVAIFNEPLRVLVVDDNEADLRLMQEALTTTGTPTEIITADGGEKALALLHRADVPRPDIVILDINMPRISGHDVLRDIKANNDLRSIVVLMFSSSQYEKDVTQAYASNANGYVTKPTNLDEYFSVARRVTDFWSRVATLPCRLRQAAV